jgi:hypothetical protein
VEQGLALTWGRVDELGVTLFGLSIDSCSVIGTVVAADLEEVGEVASPAPILSKMILASVTMMVYL